jgi:hypothetical protein
MKLTAINIQNFLGARSVDVQITRPVALFAGGNGSGKSSVQEAVRMALTGESVRVSLKKDYGQLVSDGEKTGSATVYTAEDGAYSIALPSGKGTCLADPPALPYVLDAQRFASLDANARRAFLFSLMGLSASGDAVRQRLTAKGCDPAKVDAIMPLLRAGFDAACKEAQDKARDEKAAWRTITTETYGEKKAEAWEAVAPTFDADVLTELQRRAAITDTALAAANQRLGVLKADRQRHLEATQRLAEMRERAGRCERIAGKLERDEAELKEWEAKVEDTRQRAAGGRKIGLVHDLAHALNEALAMAIPIGNMDDGQRQKLKNANVALAQYQAQHGSIGAAAGDIEAQARLPEYEQALHLLQSAVANGKRDLAQADAAAQAVTELEAAAKSAPDEAAVNAAQSELSELAHRQQTLSVSLDQMHERERAAKNAAQRTEKARAAHQAVQQWCAIATALAPNGIPGEMLAEALDPINNRLSQSADATYCWPKAHIEPDMSIWAEHPEGYGFPCSYELLSESEQWRVDAMIAEAISHLSGAKLLVLDRFDVLDIQGRSDLLGWLDILARRGDIDTALIFGTLKSKPEKLLETMEAFWLGEGK